MLFSLTFTSINKAIEAERSAKNKAEKQRSELAHELSDLGDRLEEAGGATTAQVELNKKREAELSSLRRDLEEANVQHEATASQMKRKHQEAVSEMGAQMDLLQKAKNRLEKEKQQAKAECDELKMQLENSARAKVSLGHSKRFK